MTHQDVSQLASKHYISLGNALNFLREDVDPEDLTRQIPVKIAARIMMIAENTLYAWIRKGKVSNATYYPKIMITVGEIMRHIKQY